MIGKFAATTVVVAATAITMNTIAGAPRKG